MSVLQYNTIPSHFVTVHLTSHSTVTILLYRECTRTQKKLEHPGELHIAWLNIVTLLLDPSSCFFM